MVTQIPYMTPKPPTEDDRGVLKILAIFHCCIGGLAMLGVGMMGIINSDDPVVRRIAMMTFVLCAVFFGSGLSMSFHRYRIFSLIVALITCFAFPAGTILGVWTMVALCKPGISLIYQES
jgi:hypothetical protein